MSPRSRSVWLALVLTGCSAVAGTGSAPTPTEPATPVTTAPTTTPIVSTTSTTTSTSTSTTTTTTSSTTTSTTVAARDFGEVDAVVTDFVAERGLDGAGLIVVHADDGVVHERYWGDFGPDRVSLVASSSKQITALVLLHLQDEGLIDLDAPVADAVAWGSANPDVTPAQLLSSRSGLVGLFPVSAYQPYACQFEAVGNLLACAEMIFTSTADDADQVPPDTEFRYGGGQWQVAGGIAEAVTGRSWSDLVADIVAEPCGLETLGYNNHFGHFRSGFDYPVEVDGDVSVVPPTDNPNLEGGAHLSVPDYGRLLLMHLAGGRCGDARVVSPEALDQMYADGLATFGGTSYTGGGYGMGWWIDRETGRLTDPGAFGTVPWLDLADGYGAYLAIELDAPTGGELASLLYDPVERAVLGG